MLPLVIIPARGGSKGIPHKNIKELGGKPLIYYAIDAARKFTTDDNICVSTDDDNIIKVVEDYGLSVLSIWLPTMQAPMECSFMRLTSMSGRVITMIWLCSFKQPHLSVEQRM